MARGKSTIRAVLIRLVAPLVAIVVGLGLMNASALAPMPKGTARFMAHTAVSQQLRQNELKGGECLARYMAPPLHRFLENTLPAIVEAGRLGADLVEVDVLPSADGTMMLFHDAELDCRSDGHGPARAQTEAALRKLDVGYGWTANGGKTFPLRGQYRGTMPSVSDAFTARPNGAFLFNFKSDNPQEADLLAAALKAAGRDPVAHGDAFFGNGPPVERIGRIYPDAWHFDVNRAIACSKSYARWGWLGITPNVCKGAALIVPVNRTGWFAGWPNRTIARMEAVGAQVIITGPYDGRSFNSGLDLPEQVKAIPPHFSGYVWIEDWATLGALLHPDRDRRTAAQKAATEAALKERRASRAR
ncbi:MAG: hypothetical protein KDE63_03135 [Novosphingobium sp.]|nr:hypothetical protein [Novosphingobium sp.]